MTPSPPLAVISAVEPPLKPWQITQIAPPEPGPPQFGTPLAPSALNVPSIATGPVERMRIAPPPAEPHAFLFGTWIGGTFPPPRNAPAARCLAMPSVIFTRDLAMRSTLLDPTLLNRALLVFIEVVLDRTTPEVFDAFKHSVQIIPEVLECHMVAGGFDYLVKARVKDMAAYREFLGKTLLQKGVRETHTYAVMEEVKNTTKLPIK